MEKLYRINLSIRGVKRKCRKSDRHFFHLGSIPYNNGEISEETLLNVAKGFIETNMKTVDNVPEIILSYVEKSVDDFGTIETVQLFDKRNKSIKVLSLLENELR